MSEKKFLVKFRANWADEFDVHGFCIWTEKEWESHKDYAKERFEEEFSIEIGFGSNQAVEYNGFEEYMRSFTVTEITAEEAAVLQKHFGNGGRPVYYGMLPIIED